MVGKFKYPKAVIAFITAFAVFLVGMDVLLVSQERKKLYTEFENQAQNELVLIGTFVTEPILKHQYSVVEQFILQWGEKKPEILELEAFSPKKYSLARFKRLSPKNHSKSFRHIVKFMDRNLLELVVVKSSSAIESHLKAFWGHLIFRSFFVLGVFGIILWFILQQFALRPLEEEVKRRRRAENELQKAHDHLESEVEQRTMELSTEKELLSVTLRSIGDGVITTDVDGRIVLMNKMAETLTGWQTQDAAGQPLDRVFNIINVKTREPCESPVHKVIDTGQIIGLENHTVLIAKDGSQKNIADSGAPIRNKKSRIIGVVLVFRDTTDQLRMEQELMKIEKLESIGVLAGGIAHDFNNILAGILGNINLAAQEENLKNRTKEYLISAEKASLRAKDLTQQLLTFSKGGEPVKQISGLGNIIRNSAGFVLHGNKVNCRFDIPEDLWLVDIDKGQISQVIQNIVLNAGHAMPDGGTIEICCENIVVKNKRYRLPVQKGNYVKICIQDTGTGIPNDVIGKIFDPYFSTKKMGSGLGLAITHSIILKHGGYIFVESTLGGGTTFTIYLPSSTQQKTPNFELSAQNGSPKKAKILLMDDEEMVRAVTRSMLTQFGHDVVLCAKGEEALKLYCEGLDTNNNFNLAIMDLTIPGGMGGQETAREILKMDPKAKLIVSSGYSNNPVMASYEEYGFCGTIVKPYRIQELSKVINQVLALNP
jgi:PAS domain S-box-containing protein